MKKIFVALLATFVAVGMVGCVGKGKAPPPVVTKGSAEALLPSVAKAVDTNVSTA